MKNLQLSIIIPVFNKWELTCNCLKSIKQHSVGINYEVIVVDNASTDATGSVLASFGTGLFAENFTALRNEQNINFGPACNQGARQAQAPLLLFLNNDTIVTAGWLPPLLDVINLGENIGAVGPLLLYEDDTVQHLGITFSSTGVYHLYNGYPRSHPLVHKKRSLQGLTAAAILLRATTFWHAEGFYEGYKNGFEDVELSLRLKSAGKDMFCVPESVVYHLESQSEGRSDANADNGVLLESRCGELYRIDTHLHALADGFEVVLDDFWSVEMRLPKATQQQFDMQAQGDPQTLYALCQKNPAWVAGWQQLANILQRSKDFASALECYEHVYNQGVTLEVIRKMHQLAVLSGNARITALMGQKLIKFKQLYSQEKLYLSIYNKVQNKAALYADDFLQNILTLKKDSLNF